MHQPEKNSRSRRSAAPHVPGARQSRPRSYPDGSGLPCRPCPCGAVVGADPGQVAGDGRSDWLKGRTAPCRLSGPRSDLLLLAERGVSLMLQKTARPYLPSWISSSQPSVVSLMGAPLWAISEFSASPPVDISGCINHDRGDVMLAGTIRAAELPDIAAKQDHLQGTASDEALVQSIADGDRRAMAQLYARHSVRLYRFILRLTRNAATAEDLVSEVFLEVWRAARRFRAESHVSTWLLAIARNRTLSFMRRRADEPLDDRVAATIEDPADDPESSADKVSRRAIVRSCLQRLSSGRQGSTGFRIQLPPILQLLESGAGAAIATGPGLGRDRATVSSIETSFGRF